MAFMISQLGCQKDENERSFDFTALPDLVKTRVCRFLDLSSLMNLRLTCRALKKIVEQPKVLELMPIKIRTGRQLKRVLESGTKYTFFILSFHSLNNQSHFHDFVDAFGPSIRKLIVTTWKGSRKVLTLLQSCSQIEELELADLDFNLLSGSDNKDLCNKVICKLKKLKKLVIHSNETTTGNAMIQIETFFNILAKCCELEEFKIPEFMENSIKPSRNERVHELNSDGEEDWEPRNVPQQEPPRSVMDDIIEPILKYMQRGAKPARLKMIDVAAIKNFKWNTFYKFVESCSNKGVRLVGIHSTQFSYLETSSLHPSYYKIFLTAKVLFLHKGFPLSEMKNLCQLSVNISPDPANLGICDGDDISLPNLEILEVKFFSESERSNQFLIQRLLKYPRSKVHKLQIDWFFDKLGGAICALDVTKNFKNLTELNLNGWNAIDEDFMLLWTNLNLLEKITLRGCRKMTNRAFVGDYDLRNDQNIYQRPFNRLMKLHYLTIHDQNGRVSEIAFLNSFRWMKLRYLEFVSTRINTFPLEVYQSLVSSPFGRSIEYFSGPMPNPSHEAIRGFRNLKKPLQRC